MCIKLLNQYLLSDFVLIVEIARLAPANAPKQTKKRVATDMTALLFLKSMFYLGNNLSNLITPLISPLVAS